MAEDIQARTKAFPTINSKTTVDSLLRDLQKFEEATPPPPEISGSATDNPAAARCSQAYARALKAAKDRGKNEYSAEKDAESAYRSAMPSLSGHQNIQDFIACAAHGMLIGAISGADAARLLYAAQVAHSTLKAPVPKAKSTTPQP